MISPRNRNAYPKHSIPLGDSEAFAKATLADADEQRDLRIWDSDKDPHVEGQADAHTQAQPTKEERHSAKVAGKWPEDLFWA